MKNATRAIITHPLISGSVVILFGTLSGNIFNFLFNLFMSRNLNISQYGTLVSLSALIILASIPVSALTPTIVNFSASHFANGNLQMIQKFFYRIMKPFLLGSFLFLFLFVIFSSNISAFFHIPERPLIILSGITIFIAYLNIVNTGLLQARLSFKFLSFINFLSPFLKFVIGVILVLSGFQLGGAMVALLLSFLAPFVLGFIPLRFLLRPFNSNAVERIRLRSLVGYGLPSAVAIFGLNALISADLLLVKHLFTSHDAGLYAGIALIAKVIFFLTAPIGTVMFPLIIQKHAKKEQYRGTLYLAVFLVFLPSIIISLGYFLFPEIAIKFFLKNNEYLKAAGVLGYYGIFISIFSLVSLLTYYFLSIKKTLVWVPVMIAAFLQVVLIYIYHESFSQIIFISITISILLLLTLLLYFRKSE